QRNEQKYISQGMQVEKDNKQRGYNDFQQANENKISDRLSQKESIGRGRRAAKPIQHLIAQLARPALVERNGRGEQKCHPHQAADNTARFFRRGLKGEAEDHHHQQSKEQHTVGGV